MSIANSIKHLALKVATVIHACNYYLAIGSRSIYMKLKGRASDSQVLDKLRFGQASEARYRQGISPHPTSHSSLQTFQNAFRKGSSGGKVVCRRWAYFQRPEVKDAHVFADLQRQDVKGWLQ